MFLTKRINICGHYIELELIEYYPNNIELYLNEEMLTFKIMDNIIKQIKAEKTMGDFKYGTRLYCEVEGKKIAIRIKGKWHILPNYILFYRIFRWWYNCNIAPERIETLFRKAFKHNYQSSIEAFEKTYNRNIFDFIGYIGDHYDYGYAFMEIILLEVDSYEKKFKLSLANNLQK